MTIIACSSKERLMIADTRLNCGSFVPAHAIKIARAPDGSIGGAAGKTGACEQFLEWMRQGCKKQPPAELFDSINDIVALRMTTAGDIFIFATPVPVKLLDSVAVIGSGDHACLGALYAGASLRRAVEIACELTSSCGGALTVLSLDAPSPKRK